MNIYLTQGLHRAAQQNPARVASRFGERTQTYLQLRDRVARLAAVLAGLGVKPGDRVALLALNSDRYLEYYLATWWVGGIVNPVNVRWSPAEIAFSLNDCATRVLLVDEGFLKVAPQLRAAVPGLQHLYCVDDECPALTAAGIASLEPLIARAEPVVDQCPSGDSLAAIFYTGGTTGQPKGVMLSHANLWSSGISRMAQVHSDAGSVAIHVAPLFHLA